MSKTNIVPISTEQKADQEENPNRLSFTLEEMLEEFDNGSVPRSKYWRELITALYDTGNHVVTGVMAVADITPDNKGNIPLLPKDIDAPAMVRMDGADSNTQQTNQDVFGRSLFYGDACKVVHQYGAYYEVLAGTAYVAGIRFFYPGMKELLIEEVPNKVWVDVSWPSYHMSERKPLVEIRVSNKNQNTYDDGNSISRYMEGIASINDDNLISDLRIIQSKPIVTLARNEAQIDATIEISNLDLSGYTHLKTEGYNFRGDDGGASWILVKDNSGNGYFKKDKAKNWWKLSSNHIMPEMFGAIGNWNGIDGTNDTKAIKAALNIAISTKKKLQLCSGKQYRITDSIKAYGDVEITSTSSGEPAKIIATGITSASNRYIPIMLGGERVSQTTILTSQAFSGDKLITVADSSIIKTGDIIMLRSSENWPYDPRSETTQSTLKKGEVHIAREVFPDGSIYMKDHLYCFYNDSETVEVTVFRPSRVMLRDIHLDVISPAYSRTVGIVINAARDSVLNNITTRNSKNSGITLQFCVETNLHGIECRGMNDTSSGYGISIVSSTLCKIFTSKFFGCRRGIDVSAAYTPELSRTEVPAHNCEINNCHNFGGGRQEDGKRYFDEAVNYGFGSHGGSNLTRYEGCEIGSIYNGINIRGTNEIINNCTFSPKIKRSCIIHDFGDHLTVTNNKYKGRISGLAGSPNFSFRAESFIRIMGNINSENNIVIEGNIAEWLGSEFIRIDEGVSRLDGICVSNNLTLFRGSNSATEVSMIRSYNSSMTLSKNAYIFDNNMRTEIGVYHGFRNFDPARAVSLLGSPKTYSIYIKNNESISFETGAEQSKSVTVFLHEQSGLFQNGIFQIYDRDSRRVDIAEHEYGSKIEITDTILTGETGNNDTITMSYIDGLIYLENRLGQIKRMFLTVYPVT